MHKHSLETSFSALLWLLIVASYAGLHDSPAMASSDGPKIIHQAHFKIVGLGCLACIREMERTIRLTPGVIKVAISAINKGDTTVIYSQRQVSLAKLTDGIKKQGYPVSDIKDTLIKTVPKVLPSADKYTMRAPTLTMMEKPRIPPLK